MPPPVARWSVVLGRSGFKSHVTAADPLRVSVESTEIARLGDAAIGQSADDLRAWTLALEGGPGVTHVQIQHCRGDAAHGEERPFWFFAEADPHEGLIRLRCVACGDARGLFDSDRQWSYPPMHACLSCEQSMMEISVGVHAEESAGRAPVVTWAVIGARCVMCGRMEGLTDVLMEAPYPALEHIDTVL